jgi:hypothetical protein|nr:MAG TPA: hypothetical protein [Caudoviricetes sp.]
MINETLVMSVALSAQDLFLAARRLEYCDYPGVDPDVLDDAEGELIDARSAVEEAIASILMTFGVLADVELHRIVSDGME